MTSTRWPACIEATGGRVRGLGGARQLVVWGTTPTRAAFRNCNLSSGLRRAYDADPDGGRFRGGFRKRIPGPEGLTSPQPQRVLGRVLPPTVPAYPTRA